MAENNSKKPMALLLLVVVGVLVVLYFAGGESDCNKVVTPGSCSDGVSAEADCTGDDKEWKADVTEPVTDAADEAACTAAGGTWTGEKAADPVDPPATDPPAGN